MFGRSLLAAILLPLGAIAAQAVELRVYTAAEADQLKEYKAAFETANPDITIEWVRDSTGIITAKLLAEKANPQADAVFALAATSLMVLAKEDMLMPYAPAGLADIKPSMRDPVDPPSWVGSAVWASAICFNKIEAENKSLPVPSSWQDLTKPEYKGQIAMPNPASSDTGFLMVSAWLQQMGEEKGWAFMDQLNENIASYTHSGSKPCRQAGGGEYAIGLSFEYRANKTIADGAPIQAILPAEGLGWDMEATAMMKGTVEPEAAQKLANWATSPEASAIYAKSFAVVALKDAQPKLEHIEGDVERLLIKNDFAWAAANRERILAEWTKRYDGKSEPKS